eukprot:TRINITY_DN10582_c0_g1_i2.p1 TRINITY_DN10582_c0_g1~~TRINITY_DN10582_c0_g1_i2.p1  ORF type:complete len:198 (-),score=41.43 TRINITY_DN10582_c0_g1_i2:17-577(-)
MAAPRWRWLKSSASGYEVGYDKVPAVDPLPVFENIRTMQDIRDNMPMLQERFKSSSACYYQLHENADDEGHKNNQDYVTEGYCSLESIRNTFIHDQQDCVLWALEPGSGRVYMVSPYYNNPRTYCAHSLPEFLTRWEIENSIQFKEFGEDDDDDNGGDGDGDGLTNQERRYKDEAETNVPGYWSNF